MEKPYIVEITTFKYKSTVNAAQFWAADAKVEKNYTALQPGFISRESGLNQSTNEVIVIVRWESQIHADASMAKFMEDKSTTEYANMIDGESMKMKTCQIQ